MAETSLSVQGREEPFDGPEIEMHVATIRVVLSYRPSTLSRQRDREADLLCVAERAVYAAAGAYNFHSTRIVSVDLVGIEPRAAGEKDAPNG